MLLLIKIICICALLTGLLSTAALAVPAKNFVLATPGSQEKGEELVLRGTAVKHFFLIKILSGALYMPLGVANARLLNADVSKCLHVTAHYGIAAKDLKWFIDHYIKDNITEEELASLKGKIEQMKNMIVDLKGSDTFSLYYQAGRGTYIMHNGRTLGIVEGELFAKALFSIWFGEKPVDRSLKKQFLRTLRR